MLLIVGLMLLAPLLSPSIDPAPYQGPHSGGTPAPTSSSAPSGPKPLAASVSLGLTTSTPSADPKGKVVFTLFYNNTGDQSAPDAWMNVSAPLGLSFLDDTAVGNLSGYPHYHFALVSLGLHAFQMDFRVAIGVAPGSILTLSATMVYSDGAGAQQFVGPAQASVQVGLETKSLYLGWSVSPPGVLRPIPPGGPLVSQGMFLLTAGGPAVNFDLAPVLSRSFRALNVSAVLYVQPVGTPSSMDMNLTLIDVNGLATTFVASVRQTNTVTGPGYWTFFYTFPSMDYLFASGHRIRLEVLNTANSTNSAVLATNATAEPSRISLVTTTYVNVDAVSPTASPPTYLSPKSTLVILANVSDPFGSGEIVDVRLNLTGPSGALVSWLSLLPAVATDPSSPSAWALFRYTRPPLLANGTYAIELTAVERNGVTDIASTSFTVRAPAFSLQKVASVAQSKSGSKFSYTIGYNNAGTGPAGTVWINDTLPSQVNFLSSSPAPTSSAGSTYRWVDHSVAVGSHSIQINVQVTGGVSGVAYFRNWASLNFTDEQGFPWPSEMSHADVVLNGPILALDVTSSPPATLHSNETVLYTITMTNTGDPANTLWLNDTLPSGIAYVSDTSASLGGTRTVSGDRILYVFTSMPSGSPTPVTWSFALIGIGRAGLVGGASLLSRITLNDTSANNVPMPEQVVVAPLTAAAPSIGFAALSFGIPTAAPGTPLPVYVNFTNAGNEPASRVWMNLSLDPFLRFSGSPLPATSTNTTVTLTMTSASVGPDSALLYLVALPAQSGQALQDGQSLSVSGTLASADAVGNVLGTGVVTPASVVVAVPRVGFALVPATHIAEAGTGVQYTVTGGNTGSGIAERVWLNLSLPASLTYVSDTFGASPAVLGSMYSWSWANYAPGSHTYLLNLTANGAATDGSTADLLFSVEALDIGGYPQPPATFAGRVSFLAPAWSLSISADRNTTLAAGKINYTVRAQNVGETAARYLWLLLPLDPSLQLITHTAPVPATGTSTLNWTFQDVQPGQSIVFNVLAQVEPGTPANTPIVETLEARFTNSMGVVLAYVRSEGVQVEVQADFMPLLYILAFGSLAGAGIVFLVYRRYRVRIEDIFLIYRDGILVSHLATTADVGKDEDQLSGMLTAVQDFVQDAFAYGGHRELNELEFGEYHILIERGKFVYLAVVYVGRDSGLIRRKVRAVLGKVESQFGAVLETWDGDMHRVEGTGDLLREGFLDEDRPWSLVRSKGS